MQKNTRRFETLIATSWATVLGELPEGFRLGVDSGGESTQLQLFFKGEGYRNLSQLNGHEVNGEGVCLGQQDIPFRRAGDLNADQTQPVVVFFRGIVSDTLGRLASQAASQKSKSKP